MSSSSSELPSSHRFRDTTASWNRSSASTIALGGWSTTPLAGARSPAPAAAAKLGHPPVHVVLKGRRVDVGREHLEPLKRRLRRPVHRHTVDLPAVAGGPSGFSQQPSTSR
jgi:hypothetical protein